MKNLVKLSDITKSNPIAVIYLCLALKEIREANKILDEIHSRIINND